MRVQFSETLRGHVGWGAEDADDGFRLGRRHGTGIELQLHVVVEDLDRFMAGPSHDAPVTGQVECAELGGKLPIARGTYAIRAAGERTERRIGYSLELDAGDAGRHVVRGGRSIDDEPGSDLLRRASSLSLEVEAADGRTAAGIAGVRHLDFVEQLGAMQADAPTAAARMTALDRFGRASFGPLWEVHERRAFPVASPPQEHG